MERTGAVVPQLRSSVAIEGQEHGDEPVQVLVRLQSAEDEGACDLVEGVADVPGQEDPCGVGLQGCLGSGVDQVHASTDPI